METVQVIICGCGPTGGMLLSILGSLDVKTICIDKGAGITSDPRGIALDEDGIRALQGVGIYSPIYSDIGRCTGIFKFIGGIHNDLNHPPFMSMDYTTSEGGTGHVGFISHKQPQLEKYLRSSFATDKSCQLRERCTLRAASEDQDWVYAMYDDANGNEHVVRAKYLVGADGKTGFTRKMYLEPRGVILERSSRYAYEATWVAVNWRISLPTPASHPEFPLWALDYTPEQVFDLFFPKDFRFLCNPERPTVGGRFGTTKERLWRFEFVVKPDEDGSLLSQPTQLWRILGPYVTHPGSRYGLEGNVQFPPDCIETIRARPFRFAARSCNKWALGRVVLCGDSAHVFPPFGGQGIASGFRDAYAVAWRLKVACQPGFHQHEALFAGYSLERKQQLEKSLAATVQNGRYVTETNALKIWLRDTYLQLCQRVPSWRRQLEQGARRDGMCRYEQKPGVHFLGSGGLLLPQVYCARPGEGVVGFTDDAIFAREKQGLFQQVVIVDRLEEEELPKVQEELRQVPATLGDGYILVSEATVLVMDTRANKSCPLDTSTQHIFRVATSDEFAQSELCRDRPPPKYYDEHRITKELPGMKYIIVRPDRFVFAACANIDQLTSAFRQIRPVLDGETADQ